VVSQIELSGVCRSRSPLARDHRALTVGSPKSTARDKVNRQCVDIVGVVAIVRRAAQPVGVEQGDTLFFGGELPR
jgi:hypothetical protein